mmetsp:Transcript_3522/g.7929  ORF Transcript_3522/g.7929 Transcript_3522/m.7929 type:complete len:456 (+) Transcript_3522:120-1487(+)|eukprot:CAMPEP_0206487052 /NCGR_PEP_ID=MMETSP0324_2-20121206/41385_1 /ASSEMBLY_ACC=CAM_ASM_000836 /TAXON_ID=2866 /ORGANISM="Crypthecodinium cohnii, Strain Seligo" /LENGTH=455 /DNA_ID=CAMNT_0053965407 /DNA_START=100 /DNA_END=1467 /DNA_ORIENTATION=+
MNSSGYARHSRGQAGNGVSLPKSVWGTGTAAAAAAAVGPSNIRSVSPGPDNTMTNQYSTHGSTNAHIASLYRHLTHEEAIAKLESVHVELEDLRSRCAYKDQRIGELQKRDALASRLRRDLRSLASELHGNRSQLVERERKLMDLKQKFERAAAAANQPKRIQDNQGAAVSAALATAQRELQQAQEKNRQLAEALAQAQAEKYKLQSQIQAGSHVTAPGTTIGAQHFTSSTGPGKAMGLAQSRFINSNDNEQPQQMTQPTVIQPNNTMPYVADGLASRGGPPQYQQQQQQQQTYTFSQPQQHLGAAPPGYVQHQQQYPQIVQGTISANGTPPTTTASVAAPQGHLGQRLHKTEEIRPVVYSTSKKQHEHHVGRVHLQGYGVVDGATQIAKVLMTNLPLSVYSREQQQRRMALAQAGMIPHMVHQGGMMVQHSGVVYGHQPQYHHQQLLVGVPPSM